MAAIEMSSATFATSDGIELAADIAGDPWLPRLVFVHGGGQSRRSWRPALQTMVRRGFSVVSYDLRGHGESGWSATGDYGIDAHVRDLTAVIRAMPEPPALVGASLGGRVALATAAALEPQAVRSLVLVDIAPRIGRAGLERVTAFFRRSLQGFDNLTEAAAVLETFSEHRTGANYFHLAHSIRTGSDGRIYWRHDPRTAEDVFLNEMGLEDRLSWDVQRLRCPLALVRGTHSDIVPQDCADHLLQLKPDARVIEIEGAGHLMRSEHLDSFCEQALGFLQDFRLRRA